MLHRGKSMKRKVFLHMLIIGAVLVLSACGNKTAISVKEKNIRMNTDEKYTVKLTGGDDENIVWTSNDEGIALVSPEGTITATGNGITTVTAKAEDSYVHVGVIVGGNNDYTDEFGNVVEVFDGESDITEISVGVKNGGKGDVSVKAGESFQLRAYVTPSDSKDKIVWRVADSTVARVDEKGVLQTVGAGKTTVTAYAPNGVKGELIVRVK